MMLFPRMFWKNGLKIARITLWASNYLPSSLTRVTTVKLLIWNDYFTDVALAGEDGKQFEAHKVILATNLDSLHSSLFYNSRGSWWWWWWMRDIKPGQVDLKEQMEGQSTSGQSGQSRHSSRTPLQIPRLKSIKSIWSEWTFKVAAVLHCITNEFKELLAELTFDSSPNQLTEVEVAPH